MFQIVKNVFFKDRREDRYTIEAVGSYRRGVATCGDMDILITRKDGAMETKILKDLVFNLERINFITESLTSPKDYNGCSTSYMGVCLLDGKHHRIDFKIYPPE